MIPYVVAPLNGVTVLVTRPQPQASALAATLRSFGGEAIVFPAIAIEPCETSAPPPHDWVIWVSVHAVEHGARWIDKSNPPKIAAIGKATANALQAADLAPDVVAAAPYTSEALLAHEAFQPTAGECVLIMRGGAGRDTLRTTLTARGVTVNTLDVYRRVKPAFDADELAAIEQRWADEGIDAVTATSADLHANLVELLSPTGRALLNRTALLAPTPRILEAARGLGWDAEGLITTSADDAAIVGALARRRLRARDA